LTEYEEGFQAFLKALEANDNAPVCFDEPLSELTQSYWKFFDRVKTDVISFYYAHPTTARILALIVYFPRALRAAEIISLRENHPGYQDIEIDEGNPQT
jgi:hypothetical protein